MRGQGERNGAGGMKREGTVGILRVGQGGWWWWWWWWMGAEGLFST